MSKRHFPEFFLLLSSLLALIILSDPNFSSVRPDLLIISTDWMLALELTTDLHSLLRLTDFVVVYNNLHAILFPKNLIIALK